TEAVRFCRRTVPYPMTTTSSNVWLADGSSTMVCPSAALMGISNGLKPSMEKVSMTAESVDVRISKAPWSSDCVRVSVPLIPMVTPAKGVPFSSVTFPLACFCAESGDRVSCGAVRESRDGVGCLRVSCWAYPLDHMQDIQHRRISIRNYVTVRVAIVIRIKVQRQAVCPVIDCFGMLDI